MSRSLTLIVLLAMTSAACVVKRESVRSLPVGDPVPAGVQPQILVEVLVDGRGDEANRTMGTSYVPVLNLIHLGFTSEVPEHDASITSNAYGFDTQLTGSFERDLGALFADLLPGAVFVDDVAPGSADLDYVLTGTLERTGLRTQVNIVPGAILSALGLPFLYYHFDLKFTLELHRCGDRSSPVLTQTYAFTGKRVGGAYYGNSAARSLLVEGLRETFDQARADVIATIAIQGPCPRGSDKPAG